MYTPEEQEEDKERSKVGEALKGISASGYVSMAAGALSIYDGINDTIQNAKDWSADLPSPSEDANGMPVYNLGASRNALQEYDTSEVGKGLGLDSAVKGASAMAQTGNPFAVAGGAIVGGAAGLVGKRRARRQAERAKLTQENAFSDAQGSFNTQLKGYDTRQDAIQQQAAKERQRYEMLGNIL